MISIKGLHKYFNKGRPNELHVINDVSLELPERGMVAIFGKSGCGKTTLLNVIGGLDEYASGTLTVEDQSIRRNTDVIRNKYIGYIFQNYNLSKAETCFDNVAAALRLCGMTDEDEIAARVDAALTNVGMEKYAKRTPDTLSGGQQQRIAIARAIVKNPRIILADEPTGNLDEANTVMIMDLLKAIARDHLVLLVTHEAELVDYYCDTVIELMDGRIVSTRQNTAANGYAAKDKNDIYLGELSRREISDVGAEITYYGDPPPAPLKLTVVNHDGRLYVKLGSPEAQILDAASEIKLHEGVYEQKSRAAGVGRIDMSALPPVEGERFGRLFSLRSSIRSGYAASFQKKKRGKRVLRGCMCLFSAVVVFASAVFGTAFGKIINAQASYNHNVFYVYTPSEEVSLALNAAVGAAGTGVDRVYLQNGVPTGDHSIYFRTGSFETFAQYDYQNNFKTNAAYLDAALAANAPLLAGKRTLDAIEEILISDRVADALLQKSTLGYITEREDLIGLVSELHLDGRQARVVGIVETGEPAVYMSTLALARYSRATGVAPYTSLASDYGLAVAPGEAVLAIREERAGMTYPSVGETVKLQGRDIKVVDVKRYCASYEEWLLANGIEKPDEYTYFSTRILAEDPTLAEDDEALKRAVDEEISAHRYEYYDYLYAELGEYFKESCFFGADSFETWLYVEKEVEVAKYALLSVDYYKATVYKERFGVYPTLEELWSVYDTLPELYDSLKEYARMYEEEYYLGSRRSVYINTYMVNEEDFIAFSHALGETHPTARDVGDYGVYADAYAKREDVSADTEIYFGNVYYTVLHSSDPRVTEAWLALTFDGLRVPYSYTDAVITPASILEDSIGEQAQEIVTSLVTLAAILILMSLCMYFIMRSSLMNRIKEVGICRAIGVSKRNLVFKFLIEAAVLTTLTVLVGYVLAGGFLFLCLGTSSMVAEIFYYPPWLAGATLVLLYAISLFFGTLPILSLLRKSPSAILAKYDI